MSERRGGAKGRRLGSSRRKQLRESSREAPATAPGPGEKPSWASEIVQRVQDLLREQDKEFITRSDTQIFQEEGFPCSTEELELVFDGLDAAGTGRLSTEDFTAGLRQFLSSQKAAREHRRRKTASRRVHLVLPNPALEGEDTEEQKHFAAFMDQLGTDNVSEEDRAVAEFSGEVPMSPQMSPGKSDKFRSEMRIRLGSQRGEGRAKSTHQVVWEMLPAEINISGAPVRANSVEEDPFPEPLKEERFSDQSSLLREMNDAIAALSKHLKTQAPSAPPALADTACHPRDDAEPHTGPEAASAHGTTSGVLQETLSGQTSHEPFEGDLKEGPATAELRAPDMTQAGASVGAGNHMAQEPGAEQGESLEEAQRMLLLQGKGAGVKEIVLQVAECLGESREAGGQALMEVEAAGWMQEKTGWEKAQLLGEAEEARISQGENLETGLWPFDAGQAGLAEGQHLAMEELQPGATPGKGVQVLGTALQEWAEPEKLEIELGEHLEPEPPSRGEAPMGAAHGDGVIPEVTVAPGSGMREEERVSAGLQPQGEPSGADVLPARDEHGTSSRAGSEEKKETQRREAELQLKGEFGRGNTGSGGSAGAEVPLAEAVTSPNVQEGEMEADVELLEVQSSETDRQLLAELEADQDSREAGSLRTEQGGTMDPLEEGDESELGPGEEVRSAEVHSEGPSPAETAAGSPGLCELFPVKPQALELVEAEDAQVDVQLWGGLSPAAPWGMDGETALQLEDEKDGAQGQGELGLPQEPVLDPQGSGVRPREGIGGGVQPQEEAEILDTLEIQSTGANMQLLAEVDELTSIPGGSTEADVQPPSETDSLETEQGGSVDPDMQPLDEVDKAELVEMVEAKDSWTDTQLCEGASPETPQGEEHRAATEVRDETEDGGQGQGECGLPQEPVFDPQGAVSRQGAEAGAGILQEEAESLDRLEDLSTGANMQLFAEEDELNSVPGGGTEADLSPLSAAGRQEGVQSLSPGVGAGLCAAHTVDMWEEAPGAYVSPPAEATSYPEPVTAAEGPGLEAKLGEAPTGPAGQVPEDAQTLELLQGERAAAEGRPLDEAQGLDVVQGERLEAGVRSVVETQGLGLNQGCEEGVSVLASPTSEVPLHTGTLKLEMVMQEDVLIPDVWQLCASGQAAQSTLQEQVSAQGHSQQPKEKTPNGMEPEQAADRPAEPPKQEVPPVSALHRRVQPQEDTGNDQLGMTLGDSSLGDEPTAHQRQLLAQQSKDLNVGRQEKTQNDQKMSQEGKSSPGGAMAADRAGAAPKGCPKASLEPDHLYNVLFVGDSHVGKTSFLYRLHADSFTPNLTATVGLDYRIKNLVVDNKHFALRLWDSAGQERYHSMTKQFFRKADGVVLMYDITSQYSFSDVRYWLSCIQEAAEDGVAVLLLGNKTDCAAERQVPKKEGECLAKEHQLMFYECSAASGHNVLESMVSFTRLLKAREDELKNKAAEVPKAPQKKKSCCW